MRQFLIPLFVGLLSLTSVLGCGASKTSTGGFDLASRDIPADSDNDGTLDGLLSQCNSIPSNDLDLEGPISVYWDPFQGKFISDLIRLKFNSIPSELISSSTHYIHIFRWSEEVNEDRKVNNVPVEIYFQLKGTGEQINEDPVNVLSKAIVQKMIVDNNLDARGVTVSNFFDRVVMILDGMDLTYDAITIALYNSSVGSGAIDYVEVLLPAFHSNPNDYAKTHDSVALRNLHPMWPHRNSGYSDDEFWYATKELCKGF